MAITWQDFYGGYDNTGNYNNVVLCGSPKSTGFGGIPLATAHAKNYGYGIGFEGDFNKIRFLLNLVGQATNDSGVYVPNQHYVHYGGVYDWFIDIQLSKDNKKTWENLVSHEKIFSHDASQDWELCYASTWERTAKNSQWEKNNIVLPIETTHVRVSLTGEQPTMTTWREYTIEQIIPDYVPMGIRKSGKIKSLDTNNGFIKIRKNNFWVDKSTENLATIGQENQGKNRIRKNGKWLQQNKLGE